MKDNKLQKNKKTGEFHWEFDCRSIEVKDGEIVYAGSTHIVECKNHNIQKGNTNWKLVKDILDLCFCVNEEIFIQLFKTLSTNSVGYSIAKTFFEKEIEELSEKLEMIQSLLKNE